VALDLTAMSAVCVADTILRSRKTVSVYRDYFHLVIFCNRETEVVKCLVHYLSFPPQLILP
jgi:hypothetical protein